MVALPKGSVTRLPTEHGYCVIWTTTPWTIPANQALNMHPEFDYALVATERAGVPTLLILAEALVEACLARYGLQGTVIATCKGAALSEVNFRHPLATTDAGYDRLSPLNQFCCNGIDVQRLARIAQYFRDSIYKLRCPGTTAGYKC